jgi:uncharacterized membrane protein YhaH (DUF805 family)/DnaJ-domain-containing protein 1
MLKLIFSFNGRINRQTYWFSYIALFIGFSVAGAMTDSYDSDTAALGGLLILFLIWPGIALNVKRWHDRDKSGWWILINLIPYIGPLWSFIEQGFLPGTDGPNRFDANPQQSTTQHTPPPPRSNREQPQDAAHAAQQQVEQNFGDLIAMLAKIAKSDGSISSSEIAQVDRFFDGIFTDTKQKACAQNIFRHAKDSNLSFETHARNFVNMHRGNQVVLHGALDLLFQLSIADNIMSAEEDLLINEAMCLFGIRCPAYDSYKAQQDSSRFRETKNATHYANFLGLSGKVTKTEIRKKYLTLVAQYHPDKVSHLGDRLREVAEEEMKKINEAYDFLRKEYGF